MEYNNLTNEEKNIYDAFVLLLNSINYAWLFNFDSNSNISKGFSIYKENNNWIESVIDDGEIIGFIKYDNLYDLCIRSFDFIDKESRDYCLNEFSSLIENNKKLIKVKKFN